MSFRQSIVRLAQHARTPAIRFPDRSVKRELPHPQLAESTSPRVLLLVHGRRRDMAGGAGGKQTVSLEYAAAAVSCARAESETSGSRGVGRGMLRGGERVLQ